MYDGFVNAETESDACMKRTTGKRLERLERLLRLRAERGLRQQDVASFLGITTSYYGMIEQGSRIPHLDIAYKLAKFFNASVEDLFFTQ